jgi:hypothetical protein
MTMDSLRWERLLVLVGVLLAAGGLGCDMFSVRDSEYPNAPANLDPLGFSGLLRSTNQRFTRLDYYDLFMPETVFVYRQETYDPRTRAELISRLRNIESRDSAILVEWVWADTTVPFFPEENYRVALDGARYHIYLQGDRALLPDYTGYSDIGLIYVTGYWSIAYWYDYPESTSAAGCSFFNPGFPLSP